MPGAALGLATAIFLFALYMLLLSRRSAAGAMGHNGPGIRIAETMTCEHTWTAAQQVAAPMYRIIAMALTITAALTVALSLVNGWLAVIVAVVATLGVEFFFLGVASVRARKAALATQCDHQRSQRSPSATPPHQRAHRKRR